MARFIRRSVPRRLGRKVFVAAEGSVTEEDYLDMLRNLGCDAVHVIRSRARKSAPRQVLSRMKATLRDTPLEKNDQAWLLVDRDEWTASDMEALFVWEKKDVRHHVAVSNPCVEFWLLLHFEGGSGATTAEMCHFHLKKYWPDYNKHISPGRFTEYEIRTAVARAERLCRGKTWTTPCSTAFHKLVQTLLDSRG